MKHETSKFYFFRAAVLLVAGIVLVALLLDALLLRLADEAPDPVLAGLDAEAALIDTLLSQSADIDTAFAARRADIEAALGVPVNLHEAQEFAGLGADLAALAGGATITLFDEAGDAIYYRQLGGSDRILAIGPVPATVGINPQLVTWAYYLLVGILVLLWIRPLSRDLDRLRGAALKFGDDDFSARVKVPDNSRILPVARSFNAMAERIEYLVSSHRELTNAVSHELRTPLARFKFTMEILARTTDAAKKEEYLANMKQDVEELEGLIDEMLNYAKLSEQNLLLELVELDLKPWLEQLLAAYDHESIIMTLDCQPAERDTWRATMNPALMARAVNNILRNCLRYAQSQIDIRLARDGNTLTLTISDDGPGIPPDKLATLFEPFTRGDTSRDRESGGYGLGLAIAARIVQRHGGGIRAFNLDKGGACFEIQWQL